MMDMRNEGKVGGVNAPFLPMPPDLSLDQVMDRVREEVRRRRKLNAAGVAGPGDGSGRPTTWVARLPVKSAYSLSELLQFIDEEFLDVAYRTLLRREPDLDGKQHYLDALRNGFMSKIEILGAIRFSEEGRRNDVHVDGLLLPFKMHAWRRLPVIGRILGFMMAIGRLPRLSMHLQAMESTAGRHTQHLRQLVESIDQSVEKQLEGLREDFRSAKSAISDAAVQREAVLHDELVKELNRFVDARVQNAVDSLNARVDELGRQLGDIISRANDQDEGLRQTTQRLDASLHDVRRTANDIQRKVMAYMDSSASVPAPSQLHLPAASVSSAGSDLLDAHYVAFEDAFRGKREDIKVRAAYYLGPLAEAGVVPGSGPVLDLGCGRGEWLEVLTEHGYECRGIDLNSVMSDDARRLGMEVINEDAVTYLRSLPEGSIAAVTSMHLVEHLPQDVMVRMLDEILRVLKPGGLVALETPNPENVTVGACWFYLDPTHENPIPPVFLRWMVEQRGFEQAEIHRLRDHRGGMELPEVDDSVPGATQINAMAAWFTAATDYSVIARRPALVTEPSVMPGEPDA